MTHSSKPVCVVVGVGPGNGAAFARRFASEGYRVALLARTADVTRALAAELQDALSWPCDVTDASSIATAFRTIRERLGEVDVLIYNAGVGVFSDFDQTTPESFETSWRSNAFGAFLAAKEVVPAMKERRIGHVIFIGATASRRGGARTAAFAPAKAAERVLAESLAKSLWPAGIHVAHVIIDAVVDTSSTRAMFPGKRDEFFLQPADLAEDVYRLVQQQPSSWTFELEVRPSGEAW